MRRAANLVRSTTRSTAAHAEADQEAADKAGACRDAGPSNRASALADQITSAAEARASLPHATGTKAEKQAEGEEGSRVSVAGIAIQGPFDKNGQGAGLLDKHQGIRSQGSLAAQTECLPEQSLQADTLLYDIPESAAEQETLAYSPAPGSRPLEAAELAAQTECLPEQSLQADTLLYDIPESAAEQETLAYSPAPGSRPLEAAEQTLPSDAADGGPRADSAEQQTLCHGSYGAAGESEEAMFGKTGECSCLCKLQDTPINAAD